MTIFTRFALGGAAFALAASIPGVAMAQTAVGTIYACYYSAECAYSGNSNLTPPTDGPAFQITNTGTEKITGAVLAVKALKKISLVADKYTIGTIAPGASVAIIVGASNDKKKHPTGGFFTYIGPTSPYDTSDANLDSDGIKFEFSGKIGTTKVTSGIILTGATAQESVDGSVASLNFLGGPGNADGPCNDCFGSTQIATLTTVATTTARDTLGTGLAH
jgi:hypothetical protein